MTRTTLAALAALLTTPALADTPAVCKPLTGLERSCTSVQAIVRVLGKDRAERLARRCGASDADIEQARQCLRG